MAVPLKAAPGSASLSLMSRCIYAHPQEHRQEPSTQTSFKNRLVDHHPSLKTRSKGKERGAKPLVGGSTQLDIAKDGDLCLRIEDPDLKADWSYRVSSQVLINSSSYFAALLQAERYSEGIVFREERSKLFEQYGIFDYVPFASLPVTQILTLGPVSKDAYAKDAVQTMLQILHEPQQPRQPMPVSLVANLAVIADRFGVSQTLRQCLRAEDLFPMGIWRPHKKNWRTLNGWSDGKTEEFLRQILLISSIFSIPDGITLCSRLITNGSRMWSSSSAATLLPSSSTAMWWDLPPPLEEELLVRRTSILATLASLQQHFISLYSNPKTPQCTLGYDTSPACDSFQLGEMIRFFTCCGTLKLSSTFYQPLPDAMGLDEDALPQFYEGNLLDLFETLKACPSPQIDGNHKHCGLRSRFIPALQHVFFALGEKVEICGHCWVDNANGHGQQRREDIAWSRNPAGGEWKFDERAKGGAAAGMRGDLRGCYGPAREMFTVAAWNWTPNVGEDAEEGGTVTARRGVKKR